jgi:hypothetical protein
MNISDNISDSIRYPFQDWVKIIILAVISIIPIVNFISAGYFLRIVTSTIAGIDELPEFDEVGELFVNGIKFLIVGIIYMIIPIILALIGIAMGSVGLIFLVIAGILTILISIVYLMGVANMAYNNYEIGAALRFGEIMDIINAISWSNYIIWLIVLWLVLVVIGTIIGIISSALMFILVGFVIYFLGIAYLLMIEARSVGLIFTDAMETTQETPTEEPLPE